MAAENENIDKAVKTVANGAGAVALGKGVEGITTAVTGNPALGSAAGKMTQATYAVLPGEVKAGAAVGTFLGVNGVTHAIVASTCTSAAIAATVPLIVPLAVGGAVIGGICWLAKKLR